ncbi:GNAT family N-acetyltransferase [Bacillus sp. CGMCC 1.16607]|uniref:GNAT family N-acetyltransferase n=1 Tax=Bacillus sp. CGMCC 1.16607 TaxID=3351842 RepID=UPI003635440D
MVEYQIRLGTEKDEDFLWDMLYEAIYVPEGHPKPPRDILDDPKIQCYVKSWGRKGDLSFIAVDSKNTPIGAIWIRLFKEENKTYGFVNENTPILSMAVLSNYRGKGVGTLLLESLIKEAKLKGITAISLSVDPNNPALNLYTRFGFKKVGIDGTSWDMVSELQI